MKKTVIYSYLRHLVIGAFVAADTYTKGKPWNFSKGEVVWVSQAVWVAVLPQLRHAAPAFVDFYLKKKYPALGITLKDLEFSASQPEVKASI